MRSVGFDSLVPSGGSMTPTIHAPSSSRPRLPRNTDFFAFLCRLLTPPSQHLCQRVGLLLQVAGWSPHPPSFCRPAPLAAAGAVAPSCEDSASEAPMIRDLVPHDTNAAAGQARRKRLILAAVGAAVLVAVIAWAMKPGGQSAGRPGGRGPDAGRPIPVRAVAASTGSVDITVDALGTVTALKTATIHSRVDGPLLQVPFREGQPVKAGDLLAQIDPSTFQAALNQAEGQLARDQAQLAGARVDLDRYTGLLAKDSIARQTVDAQRFTVQQLEGAARADKAAVETARLQLTFTRITAPFAGRVGLRQVDPGNMVHASDTNGLVVLTQTHPIYVVFAVPSAHLAQLYPHWSRGDALTVQALDRDGKVLASGKLAAVDNQIDTSTGTIRIKAQFDNSNDALFPDQFVTARLKMDTLSGATLVPGASVQRGAPGTFVYVVNADNTVSLRKLSLGPASGELVSVQEGVQPGEKVVIDGLDKLRDGARVALIADNIRGATAPRAPPPPPAQHPHRRRTAAATAPVAPAAP